MAIKALYGRVAQQMFIISFDQLCVVIMCIFALALIPLYFIRAPENGERKHICRVIDDTSARK